jgi:mandelate racemase
MTVPRLTLRSVELRSVSVALKRQVVSKVDLFDRWPLILIELRTEEGIVGRSYLERSVRYLILPFATLSKCARANGSHPSTIFGQGALD